MSITLLADRLVTVQRRTAFVLDSTTAAASLAASRAIVAPGNIEVRVKGGTSNTGTVTVHGTVNGAPDSETLTFTKADVLVTSKRFSALDPVAFTTTGLADEATPPTVEAMLVGSDGSRIHTRSTLVSSWPMRMDRGSVSSPVYRQGAADVENTRFYIDFTTTWDPRDNDVFVDERTLEEWYVAGAPTLHGQSTTPHHWEVRVDRREGSTTT
jgi:hypothetical protein